MRTFSKQGQMSICDNYYDAVTIQKGYLVLDVTDKSSIYCGEHTTKQIKRKISKNYSISLEGITCDVSEILCLKFHMEEK